MQEGDPHHHTAKMKSSPREIMDHMREDVGKVDDPQFKALFETSAEVIGGLVKAFDHYESSGRLAVEVQRPPEWPLSQLRRPEADSRETTPVRSLA